MLYMIEKRRKVREMGYERKRKETDMGCERVFYIDEYMLYIRM